MEIFRCLAGSRLYGTETATSDTDYKAVHLPTKRGILLGRGKAVLSTSTGSKDAKNGADDTDVESFELQRFLKLASDMQTIPVELLFVPFIARDVSWVWGKVIDNRHKILNRNTKAFVGYCKGQAVRYSMRGKRLETYQNVVAVLEETIANARDNKDIVAEVMPTLLLFDGVKAVERDHNGRTVTYLDVYGRQVPTTVRLSEALSVYAKPVNEAGQRARNAMDAGGADWKALYHTVRIVDEGITLFRDGDITFPCTNRDYLMQIRAGEVQMDRVLDYFDGQLEILEGIEDKSPLAKKPDLEWIDNFVEDIYESIVRVG